MARIYSRIFTFAPCILLHLLYSKTILALLFNALSHPHFKKKKKIKKPILKIFFNNLSVLKCGCESVFKRSARVGFE
jgi:hypothetical protein